MKKSNRGIAMVYAVVTMLIVFALCMLIITSILAQITYSQKYSERFESQRVYSQIGEIFYSASGDYGSGERPKTDSPFAKALVSSDFSIRDDDNPEWQVSYGKFEMMLAFESYASDRTITVMNTDSRRVMLTVTIRIGEGNTEIVEWTSQGN